jgi:hypothetical protein
VPSTAIHTEQGIGPGDPGIGDQRALLAYVGPSSSHESVCMPSLRGDVALCVSAEKRVLQVGRGGSGRMREYMLLDQHERRDARKELQLIVRRSS